MKRKRGREIRKLLRPSPKRYYALRNAESKYSQSKPWTLPGKNIVRALALTQPNLCAYFCERYLDADDTFLLCAIDENVRRICLEKGIVLRLFQEFGGNLWMLCRKLTPAQCVSLGLDLIKHNVCVADHRGNFLLHHAIRSDNLAVVSELLNDDSVRAHVGHSVCSFDLAISLGRTKIARILWTKCPLPSNRNVIVVYLVFADQRELLHWFLKHGLVNEAGDVADELDEASRNEDSYYFDLLLQLYYYDHHGLGAIPFHICRQAIFEKNRLCVERLLKFPAFDPTYNSNKLLRTAIEVGLNDVVRLFLAHPKVQASLGL